MWARRAGSCLSPCTAGKGFNTNRWCVIKFGCVGNWARNAIRQDWDAFGYYRLQLGHSCNLNFLPIPPHRKYDP